MGHVLADVGFDLDLTLIDSADGIAATFEQACRGVGVIVDSDDIRPLIGLPLEDTMRRFVPADAVAEAVRLYREYYPSIGVPAAKLMPGASEAVAAVHRHGGRALVVTAKLESAAYALLGHVALGVDAVLGDRYAEQKGDALNEHGAVAYVGDHPGDMEGARSAGVHAVGVTTGSHDEPALREAGANTVLRDLLDFPEWLNYFLRGPTDVAQPLR